MTANQMTALLNSMNTFKDRKAHELFLDLSHGNNKLRSNERVSFLIWNIPAVITCPFATDHCKASCYARKAERIYPNCLPVRQDHFEISRQDDFTDRMIFTIEAEIARPANKGKKIVFRIHESGDFYNMSYVNKWIEIMRHFEGRPEITFVAYTKSVKFFDGRDLPSNFNLLASVWDDTSEENLEIIRRNNYRIYTAYTGPALEAAIAAGYSLCGCADCGSCGKCWNNYINNIACKIH